MHRAFFVWRLTPPLSGPRMPRPGPVRVCVCVPLLAGSGGPASRARFVAPHLFLRQFSALSLSARPPPGGGWPVGGCSCVVSFCCSFCFAPPLSLAFRVFRPWVPWALASCAPPPLLCFFSFLLCSPPCVFFLAFFFGFVWVFFSSFWCRVVLVVWCWSGVSCAVGLVGVCCCGPCASAGVGVLSVVRCSLPMPLPLVFLPVVLRVPGGPVLAELLFALLLLVGAVWQFFLSAVCLLCPPPPLVVVPCVVLCRASCRVVLRSVVCFVLCPVLCGVLVSGWVLAPCCSAQCCARSRCAVFVVLCRRALLRSMLVFFAVYLAFPWCSGLFLFLCSACAVLCWCACLLALGAVLSCPCSTGWCFVLLPVVFACLLLGLSVLCCLLVGSGGSWCRVSVVCCGVSLGAVLRRVAARCAAWCCLVLRCVVLFCSVSCCRTQCPVLGRCRSSFEPGPSGAVFCPVFPRCVCFAALCCCVVLFAAALCAVCVLGCRAVRSLSSPPCAVLLHSPLAPWSPVLCPVVLCSPVVLWCPVLLPCLVGFLYFFGFSYLKKPLQSKTGNCPDAAPSFQC